LARFEPQEATDDRLADTLGAATEQLRAAVEREAVEIISQAREQAASIEEVARQKAHRMQRDALAREDEARHAHSDRIAELIDGVDALEHHINTMLDDLRSELSSVVADIRNDRPTAKATPGNEASQTDAESAGEASPPDPVAQPEPSRDAVPLSDATEVDAATERNPVLDEMMHAQIVNMVESGTTRDEAEAFLGRFRLGESYFGMLDEVYSDHDEARTRTGDRNKRRRFGRRAT
jgi:hypothetical protein